MSVLTTPIVSRCAQGHAAGFRAEVLHALLIQRFGVRARGEYPLVSDAFASRFEPRTRCGPRLACTHASALLEPSAAAPGSFRVAGRPDTWFGGGGGKGRLTAVAAAAAAHTAHCGAPVPCCRGACRACLRGDRGRGPEPTCALMKSAAGCDAGRGGTHRRLVGIGVVRGGRERRPAVVCPAQVRSLSPVRAPHRRAPAMAASGRPSIGTPCSEAV